MERCARCSRQAISCPCIYEINGIDYSKMGETHPEIYDGGPTDAMCAKWEAEWGSRRLLWSGEYPGTIACRAFGFWCVGREGSVPYWQSVPEGTPGATEDLNRLYRDASWDPELGQFVLRSA